MQTKQLDRAANIKKGKDGPEWVVRSKSEILEPKASNFAITTRSGVSTRDPSFPTPSQSIPVNHTEGATEKGPGVKQKKDDEDERLLSIFKQIHINLPFLEAMIHMLKGDKVLKDLLLHKEKLEKTASSVKLSEECSTIIQRSLPQKRRPRKFYTTMSYQTLGSKKALADLGASINLMSHTLFRRLGISKLKPTRMSIQLGDRSIKYPIGVCENLLVKVNKFIFLVDFVVLKIDEDELVLIILGRPFLAIARAVIDVHEGKLSLRVGDETVTFNIGTSMKSKHSRNDYMYYADHTAKLVREQWVDAINHEGNWTEAEDEGDSHEVQAVSFYPRTEPIEPLEWKALENRLKPSSVEPPKLELKGLPEHLEYTFLQEKNKLPVVISFAPQHWDLGVIPFSSQFRPGEELGQNRFSGYFHIPIPPEDQEKTTFTCPYGTFAYKRMPFGLCNAPTTFQRCMTTIFHEQIEDSMEVFMDDFSIFGSSFDHCLKNLEKMLKMCKETNLVLNWEKCHFMVKKGIVLGHKVSDPEDEPIEEESLEEPKEEA
nr:hypothetical protein [Tanacetum cinerariifolium]